MGLNTAYQIARRDPNARIKIFEKAPDVGYGSTGASSAILRSFYTYPKMIDFATSGMNIYKNWEEYLQIPQSSAEYETCSKFTKTGLLVYEPLTYKECHEMQMKFNASNVRTTILNTSDLHVRYPQINHDIGVFDNEGRVEFISNPLPLKYEPNNDEECHMIVEEDAGYCEPMQAMLDLKNVLRSNINRFSERIEFYFNTEVLSVNHSSGRVKGVTLNNSESVDCEYIINCNGPWYHKIVDELDGLDIKLTINPVLIQCIYKECPELFTDEFLAFKENRVPVPFISDSLGGIYIRPQMNSKQLLVSTIVEEEERDIVSNEDLDNIPTTVYPELRDKYLHSLYHRLSPILQPTSSKVQSICGMYTICDEDVHYVIGETKLKGFIVCTGFSGHGFKSAPAVGSLIAQYLSNVKLDGDTDIGDEFFSPYRTPHPMDSKNVLA